MLFRVPVVAVQNYSVGGATDTTAWNLFLDAGGVAGWHPQTANIRLMALPPVVLLTRAVLRLECSLDCISGSPTKYFHFLTVSVSF